MERKHERSGAPYVIRVLRGMEPECCRTGKTFTKWPLPSKSRSGPRQSRGLNFAGSVRHVKTARYRQAASRVKLTPSESRHRHGTLAAGRRTAGKKRQRTGRKESRSVGEGSEEAQGRVIMPEGSQTPEGCPLCRSCCAMREPRCQRVLAAAGVRRGRERGA